MSSSDLAKSPTWSSVRESCRIPLRGISPCVGLKPNTPQNAAGRITEPLVWLPSARGTMLAATAAAEPLAEPPGACAGGAGGGGARGGPRARGRRARGPGRRAAGRVLGVPRVARLAGRVIGALGADRLAQD